MYPRPLSEREREWLRWILPADRGAYNDYREKVLQMTVIGQGRRGEGEFILGSPGMQVDLSAPLAPVFAYGVIETNQGSISITLREMMDEQISMEIVSHKSDEVPAQFEESRRWTYSTWSPGDACPQCGERVRQVPMLDAANATERAVLAVCKSDKRLWVYEDATRVNRLIPTTNYYNELMLHKNIRDPQIALNSRRLFTELDSFSDSDLTYAFLTYNKLKSKLQLEGDLKAESRGRGGLVERLKNIFSRAS